MAAACLVSKTVAAGGGAGAPTGGQAARLPRS